MKKSLLFLLLTLLGSTALHAYDAYIDGVYYNFEGNVATVTYQSYNNYDYFGAIVIPAFVTYNSKTYSVTSIGDNAFSGCSNLTSVTIPSCVTSIGNDAFYECTSLTSITIPESVTSIGDYAFYECTSLTSITILGSVTRIGYYTFCKCTSLTSITIPNSVTSIDNEAFSGCSNLTSVIIPNSVTSIGRKAFYECTSLTSVTIPNSVTSIGDYAFWGCTGLTSITIPNSVTSIGESAFWGCTGLTSVTIPNTVTSIGNYVFSGCSNLTSITIPNSVTSIGTSAFYGCSGLTSITIPNSVTSIGNYAFEYCRGLTSVHITDIATWCKISFGSTSANPLANAHHLYLNGQEITDLVIPEGITSIGNYTFLGCSSLTSVTIPNNVTSIGESAFYGCNSLTIITIPNSVTSIDYQAFYGCSNLTSITIPNSVISIGNYAFQNCSNLTSVKVDIETPLAITDNTFTNRANATLIVPIGCKSAYEAATYWNGFKEIIEEEIPEKFDITIGSTGFATYCSRYSLDFSEVSGMKAYIASGFSPSTGKLVLTRVTEVPAGEGLYLVGEAGTYEVTIAETDMMYSNLLKGVTSATTIYPTDGSYTNFILANGAHGVAFYSLSEAGQLAAGKAYLQLPTASVSEVKAISVIFDDDNEDGISRPTPAPSRIGGEVYNLQGQQVSAPKSGLYIINGKKMFIK